MNTCIASSLTVYLFCLLPDDHSRVLLDVIEDDPESDYINASYIHVSAFFCVCCSAFLEKPSSLCVILIFSCRATMDRRPMLLLKVITLSLVIAQFSDVILLLNPSILP